MNRRTLCLLLLATPCSTIAAPTATDALAGMSKRGSGEFRRYGFAIYDATLWSLGNDPTQPPLAIKLTYKRNIHSQAIVAASIDEIRKLGFQNDAQLKAWEMQMAKLFPDVRSGVSIIGIYATNSAQFYFNEKFLGVIDDAVFARTFFDIWLSKNTSAPQLRQALIQNVVL